MLMRENITHLLKLSKILKIDINLMIDDDTAKMSPQKLVEMRTLTLFQNLDVLGNYSSPQWFLSLTREKLVYLLRELMEIWSFRAELDPNTKRDISPPYGDPFRNCNFPNICNEQDITRLRNTALDVFEKMVTLGIDNDSKTLGAYYVLGSLTLVNREAANSMPWLFQAML